MSLYNVPKTPISIILMLKELSEDKNSKTLNTSKKKLLSKCTKILSTKEQLP